jgi:hypothetical protein
MREINDKYINELPDNFKRSYLDYQKGIFDTEPWGSHQPLLIHLVNTITDGSVIELGMGDNSTPLLHLLCEKLGRKLFSYEFDSNWYYKYKPYENINHKLFLLDENLFRDNKYVFERSSIIFIDSHPAWTRQHAIYFLKDVADYFIVHDTSYVKNGVICSDNNYDFSYYKNILHFNKVNRVSTLFTNKEITIELDKIFK